MATESLPVLAILGGTGDLGTGLARRWAQAGYRVIIGSRTLDKAETAANDLRAVMAERGTAAVNVEAMENFAAAEAADIVALTVPFSHQKSTLELVAPALQGKILIDVTVPLVPPRVARVQLPPRAVRARLPRTCSARVWQWFQHSRTWLPRTCRTLAPWIATYWCVATRKMPEPK
jgi:8-hydroxy-5-deazaflavin:NADPH oxidoreductase